VPGGSRKLENTAMALALAPRSRSTNAALGSRAAKGRRARVPLRTHARPNAGALGSSPALGARSSAPTIQTKLEVGPPDDRFEREADRVAEGVLRMPASATAAAASPPGGGSGRSVQRACDECAEEQAQLQRMPRAGGPDLLSISAIRSGLGARLPLLGQAAPAQAADLEEEVVLQAKNAAGAEAVPGVERGIPGLQGRGRPLYPSERAFFEPRFGHDFGEVRLHGDAQAADSARALNARAYTVGTHIVFGSGQLASGTPAGRRLLAHELTHVVQQGEGAPALQRKIKFTDPTPTRENPIKRVLSEPTLGYTLPTVNGKALPNGFDAAGSLLFDALQPQQSSYDPATKECRFADFDVTISANVTVITQPASNRWTMSLAGPEIKGIPACQSQKSVPVTMTGKPDGQTIVDLVDRYEQEHVDDLKQLYVKHPEAHFNWLMGLRAQGDDSGKCQGQLMATLGNKDALAIAAFLKDWLASVAARDAKGGHTIKNTIRAPADCASVTIEAYK
jgi:hypothetical protein